MRRLPDWIKVKASFGKNYREMSNLLKKHSVNTICRNALCPNMGRCFDNGTAAFLILGNTCTRHCLYCNVTNDKPEIINENEANGIAEIVNHFSLKHVCVTSVTRDDLPDGGASYFVWVIREIRKQNPKTSIEVLIPDFGGSREALLMVVEEKPEVLNHNTETVRGLFPKIRPQADYERSLNLLSLVKKINPEMKTKSGIMVGFGETKADIIETMNDLKKVSCDILTIGQYLRPSEKHYPVNKYYTPEEFIEFRKIGEEMGFDIKSAPLVRSSFQLEEFA